MPGYKQKNRYNTKRKKIFAGRRKQEIQDGGDTVTTTCTTTTNIEPQISPKKEANQKKK